MKRNRKLSFSFLLILFLVSTFTLFANNGFTLTQGDIDSTGLYNSLGKKVDILEAEISSDEYIIITGDSPATFTSPNGEIYLSANSIFSLTGFTTENPSVFLVDGQVNIISLTGFKNPLLIKTPTSEIKVTEPGEYSAVYTQDDDKFYNFSSYDAKVYDSLRKKNQTIRTYNYADFLANTFDNEVTADDYAIMAIDPWDAYAKAEEKETYSLSLTVSSTVKEEAVESLVEADIPEIPTLYTATRVNAAPDVPTLYVVKREFVTSRIPEAPVLKVVTKAEVGIPVFTEITRKPTNTTIITSTRTIETPATIEITVTRTPEVEQPVIESVTRTDEVTEAIEAQPAPVLITEEINKKSSFDLFLQVEKQASQTTSNFLVSLLPEYKSNTLTARLIFNANQIISFQQINQTDIKEWLSFAASFIDELSYKSFNEKFSFSLRKTSSLVKDKAGLILESPEFNAVRRNLSFEHVLSIGNYKHTMYFEDLALRENDQLSYLDFSYKLSNSFPLTIGAALLADLDLTTINNSLLYPELYFHYQVYKNGFNYTTIKLAGTLLVGLTDTAKLFEDGYMANIAAEGNFSPFKFNAGLALSDNALFYAYDVDNYSHYNPASGLSRLTIFADLGLDFGFLDLSLTTVFPFDTDQMKAIAGEDYYKAVLSSTIDTFTLSAAYRVAGLSGNAKAFAEKSQLAFAVEYNNEAFSAKTSLSFDTPNLNPQIDFVSKISLSNTFFENKAFERETLPWMYAGLETNVNARDAISSTLITVIPKFGYKTDTATAILRLPVYYDFATGFNFVSYYGNNIFSFGSDHASNVAKTFDIIADVFAFVDEIYLGNRFSNLGLTITRDGYENSTFVAPLMLTDRNEALSFNFRFLTDELEGVFFIDDLTMPSFAKVNFEYSRLTNTAQPFLSIGGILSADVFDDKTYEMSIVPELRAGLKTIKNSAFTLFANAKLDIFADSRPLDFKSFAAGATIDARLQPFRLTISGGIQNGTGTIGYLDAFAYRNRTLTNTIRVEELSYFASADVLYTASSFNIKLGYKADDCLKIMADEYLNDTFSLSFSIKSEDKSGILTLGIARKAFANDVKNVKDFKFNEFLISEKTIISAKLEKTFDKVNVELALSNAPRYELQQGSVNGVKPIAGTNSATMSFKASYRF